MPFDLTATPLTDPLLVYRYRDGIYAVDLLTTGIVHLDFFSWLNGNPATLEEICANFKVYSRPADVMMTLFTAMGLVQREGKKFFNTRTASEHLVKGSPWFLGPYYASLKDRPVCQDFLRVLRTDRAANWGSFKDEKEWTQAMEDEEFAKNFTAAMDCRGVYLGQAMAKKVDCSRHKRLLDVAGGSGIYACAMAAHYPGLQAAVFEKAPVDGVAKRAIADRGFTERVEVIGGDMFKEELPKGYDLHLISNVLHDWNEETVFGLLSKSYRALNPGGMLIIHDAHLNEDKSGPLAVASYSTLLMHSSEGKCYSTSELHPMLTRLGFAQMKQVGTAADRSVITAMKQ